MKRQRGQVIVEFALVAPLLMFVLLAYIGLGLLFLAQHNMTVSIESLAQIQANHPDDGSWRAKVEAENQRINCNASPLMPDVVELDGAREFGDRIQLTWHCFIRDRWIFDGLPITVSGIAVVLMPSSAPSPSPSP